ncbi:MAG: protein DA1 [Planctomycetota bacterium]|nr:MAG: protein DA1 [Planctomycetota bacterium]
MAAAPRGRALGFLRALAAAVLASFLGGCASAPRSSSEGSGALLSRAAPCSVCGDLATPGSGAVRWPDGRVSCGPCAEDAVVDLSEARRALDEARAALAELLGVDLGAARVTLRLAEREGLLRRAGEGLEHPDLRAFTEVVEVLAGERVERRRFAVHVLRGLPRTCLVGILAHELFHVWQTLQGGVRPGAQPAFREGAAQYAQWRVLRALGAERWVRRLEANPDPVYGVGLRRFRRLAKERGERAALRMGAQRDGFPSGY